MSDVLRTVCAVTRFGLSPSLRPPSRQNRATARITARLGLLEPAARANVVVLKAVRWLPTAEELDGTALPSPRGVAEAESPPGDGERVTHARSPALWLAEIPRVDRMRRGSHAPSHTSGGSMAKSRRKTCRAVGCQREPVVEDHCVVHGPPLIARREAEQDGLKLLRDWTVDGGPVRAPEIRAELDRLEQLWSRAWRAIGASKPHPFFGDEAEAAAAWCVTRAGDLAKRERTHRDGGPQHSLAMTDWVWERFAELEAGRRSNGTPRTGA